MVLELTVPRAKRGVTLLRIVTEDDVVHENTAVSSSCSPPLSPEGDDYSLGTESYADFRKRLHDTGIELRDGVLVEHRWWSPSMALRLTEELPLAPPVISLLPNGTVMLAEVAAKSERVHNVERPDLGGWTGGMIWDGSLVLSRVLISQPRSIWNPTSSGSKKDNRRRRVVELGCGCGMVGLTAALLGGDVTMTDQVLFMAQLNLDLNFPEQQQHDDDDDDDDNDDDVHQRVKLRSLEWGDTAAAAALQTPYDLLLGSDLMYNPRHHQHLADTLAMLSTIGSEVLWATRDGSPTRRSAARPFFYSAMETYGFVIHDITASAQVQAAMRVSFTEGPNCGEHSARGPLCVVKMVRDTVESSIVASKL